MADVQVAVELRHMRRHDAGHQALCGFQHGDVLAFATGHGGDFEADEAAADDHHVLRGLQCGLDGAGIVQRTQAADAAQVRAGQRQRPQARAGAQREAVVGQCRAVIERELLRGAIDRRNAGAEFCSELLFFHGFRRAHHQLRLGGIALQVALGQRRAVVGPMRFGADQRDRPGIALRTQGFRDGQSRQPGADNQHSAHTFFLVCCGRASGLAG